LPPPGAKAPPPPQGPHQVSKEPQENEGKLGGQSNF